MGMMLTALSLFGLVALAGVAVNDGLVLVDAINSRRRAGVPLSEAVRQAGPSRFRAVLLTSLTTFAGLMPLILEKSVQARFLIPMAISLGFGILYCTFTTLILLPSAYLILEDLSRPVRRLFGWELRLETEEMEDVTALADRKSS
jgi:multidrug efflux pump subunit AcrB